MSTSGSPHPPLRKRRKRGRPSLSLQMRLALKKFAKEVGSPQYAPQGHRDFRSWLAHLRTSECLPFWDRLSNAIGKEVFHVSDEVSVGFLRKALVREVLKYVITPRHYESPKLLTITATRHTVTSETGNTLISVFESQLRLAASADHSADNPISPPGALISDEVVNANPDAFDDSRQVPSNPNETYERNNRTDNRSLKVGLPSFQKIASLCNFELMSPHLNMSSG